MENLSSGTGILLGFIVLSLVLLIVKTKDTWRWGRIFSAIIGLPILAVAGILGYEYYQHMPKPTSEFAGVTLNMPQAEVKFLKGKPKDEWDFDFDTTMRGKVDKVLVYPLGDFGEGSILIACEDGFVRQIVAVGDSDFTYSLYGVYLGLGYQNVIDKLGQSYQLKEHSESYRHLYYKKYNIIIGFHEGQVDKLGIAVDPEKYGWIAPKG